MRKDFGRFWEGGVARSFIDVDVKFGTIGLNVVVILGVVSGIIRMRWKYCILKVIDIRVLDIEQYSQRSPIPCFPEQAFLNRIHPSL